MKKTLFALSLFAGLSALAATITDVTVSPRWPWQDKVDIDYTLDAAVHDGYLVTVALYDGDTPLDVAAASLPGNGEPRLPGRRHQVFDFAASGLAARPQNLRVVVTVSENPVRYMIVDLQKRPGDDGQVEYIYKDDARLETIADFPIAYPIGNTPAEGMGLTHIDYRDVWFGITNDNQYARSKMVFRYVPPQTDVKTGDGNVATTYNLVTLTKAYWIAVYPMTQGQYSWLTWDVANRRHADPNWGTKTIDADEQQRPMSGGKQDYAATTHKDDPYDDFMCGMRGPVNDPVNPVGWPTYGHDVSPTNLLALYRQKTGLRLDYPTEAQWEVAARAGTTGCYGDKESTVVNTNLFMRFGCMNGGKKIGSSTTCTVGSSLPNAWGLYDTLGWKGEVVLDHSSSPRISGVDPVGLTDPAKHGGLRVCRGVSSHDANTSLSTQIGVRPGTGYDGGEWYDPNLTAMRWTIEIDN